MVEKTVQSEPNENRLTEDAEEDYFNGFRTTSLRKPSDAAVIFGGQVYSYSKLLSFVESFSSGIKKLFSIKKGDKVLITLPPGLPYTIALLSMSRIGTVAIPLEPYLSEKSFLEVLSRVSPSGVIAPEGFLNHYGKNISSEIFKIGVSSIEFLTPRNRKEFGIRSPEIMNQRARGDSNIFESLCYAEITGQETIDPITDIFIERVVNFKDKKSGIARFTYFNIMNAIKNEENLFKNSNGKKKFLIECETYSTPAIVTSILYPLLNGNCIIFDSLESHNGIAKLVKWFQPEVIILENYVKENIVNLMKYSRKYKPEHLVVIQSHRNNAMISEIFSRLKTRVTRIKFNERISTPISALESVDISSQPLSDGALFYGLTGEPMGTNSEANQIAISGKQVCGFLQTMEVNEEVPQDQNRLMIHGKLNSDRIEFEEEIFESDGSEIYTNDLSTEVESQLILEVKLKGAVLITNEKGIERSNILLIENGTSKIAKSGISDILEFWFPRFIRESEIRIVESIPRSMSGTPILELIWKLLKN